MFVLDDLLDRFNDSIHLRLYRCCPNPSILFQDKTQHRNPYNHIVRCSGKGKRKEDQEEHVIKLNHTAKKEKDVKGEIFYPTFTRDLLQNMRKRYIAISVLLFLIISQYQL